MPIVKTPRMLLREAVGAAYESTVLGFALTMRGNNATDFQLDHTTVTIPFAGMVRNADGTVGASGTYVQGTGDFSSFSDAAATACLGCVAAWRPSSAAASGIWLGCGNTATESGFIMRTQPASTLGPQFITTKYSTQYPFGFDNFDGSDITAGDDILMGICFDGPEGTYSGFVYNETTGESLLRSIGNVYAPFGTQQIGDRFRMAAVNKLYGIAVMNPTTGFDQTDWVDNMTQAARIMVENWN